MMVPIRPIRFAPIVAGLISLLALIGFVFFKTSIPNLQSVAIPIELQGEIFLNNEFPGNEIAVGTKTAKDAIKYLKFTPGEYRKAFINMNAGSPIAQLEMIQAGKVFVVRKGLRVKALGPYDPEKGIPVELLDGELSGNKGYVPKFWIYKDNPGGGVMPVYDSGQPHLPAVG